MNNIDYIDILDRLIKRRAQTIGMIKNDPGRLPQHARELADVQSGIDVVEKLVKLFEAAPKQAPSKSKEK